MFLNQMTLYLPQIKLKILTLLRRRLFIIDSGLNLPLNEVVNFYSC